MSTNNAKKKPEKTYLSSQKTQKSSKTKLSSKSIHMTPDFDNSQFSKSQINKNSSLSNDSMSRFDDWSTDEIIHYYSTKIKEYEQEVKRQQMLLEKRNKLMEKIKSTKSKIYQLIDEHDSFLQQNSQILQSVDDAEET